MLLLIEIVLTIVAWRRGWRWRSLGPAAAGIAVGWPATLGAVWFGVGPDGVLGMMLLIDVAVTLWLLRLATSRPLAT